MLKQDFIMKGKKIFLRELTEEDAHGRWWQWFNDSEVTEHMNKGEEPNTIQKQLEFFRKMESSPTDVVVGICDLETKRHIGTTAFHNIREEDGQRIGNFGIIIG